ncbi:MAG: hypothetical protein Fur0016_27660 [Anaerolineales bacterium]
MQSQRLRPQRIQNTRRPQVYTTPGVLVTAGSIGLAVLLLLTVFLGDWLRAPGLQVSASRALFSPNNDGSFDIFDLTYDLQNSANVTVEVFSDTARVRMLQNQSSQTPGKHFLSWDGRDQNGALLPDGTYRIQITAQSVLRTENRTLNAQLDTVPPSVQILNSNEQMRVNSAEMLLEGVSEPNAVLWWNGAMHGMIAADGRFSLPLRLQEGPNLVTLRVIDQAGNATEIRREIQLSTRGPEITLLRPTESEWTNQQVIEVQGRVTPAGEVSINQQRVQVGEDGFFRHQILLTAGANLLHIEAKDELGNITSLNRTVYFKTGASAIELNIEDGAILTTSTLQLVGKVEPGSRVSVNGQQVTVGMLGDFQVALPLLEGQNGIEIQAIDQAGNTSRVTRNISYQPNLGTQTNWNQVGANFSQAPWLVIPALVLTLMVLAFLYWRNNHVQVALAVNQSTFVPGLPGENNTLEIYLDLSQTARVTLEVLDEQGRPRATLLRQRRKMGRQHLIPWNGLDDQARLLPPGNYTIRAEAGSPPLQVTCSIPLQIDRKTMSSNAQPVRTHQSVGNDWRR